MTELHEYDYTAEDSFIAYLEEAAGLSVTEEINADTALEFDYPSSSPKAREIKVNRLIKCLGQLYRIVKITSSTEDNGVICVSCLHIFDTDSMSIHIPTVSDYMGVNPRTLIESVIKNMDIIPSEAPEGCEWIGEDGFRIDFFSRDKLSPGSFIKQVIENCGFGEIYKDNKSFAVVKRLGTDNGLTLRLGTNLTALSVTRDATEIVNRIYVYGKDDATINSATVGGKMYGLPYIDSAKSIQIYGIKSGYKNYSDYSDPTTLYNMAQWEFSEENSSRTDMPHITIEGSLVDFSKTGGEKISLGDTVRVIDTDGARYTERIIKIKYYPFEAERTEVTIGNAERDLGFYLNQMGTLAGRYGKISTSSGKITAKNIDGAISNSECTSSVNISTSGTTSTDKLIQVIINRSTRVNIGIKNNEYVFDVYDAGGKKAIGLGKDGMELAASSVTVGTMKIEEGTDGLTINGKKILTESEETA